MRIDKCDRTKPPTQFCPVSPHIDLKIRPKIDGMLAIFNVTASAPDLTFLWEAQDGKPAMGNGASFKTMFRTPGQKVVTVTAFTKDGCRATQSITVNILG